MVVDVAYRSVFFSVLQKFIKTSVRDKTMKLIITILLNIGTTLKLMVIGRNGTHGLHVQAMPEADLKFGLAPATTQRLRMVDKSAQECHLVLNPVPLPLQLRLVRVNIIFILLYCSFKNYDGMW